MEELNTIIMFKELENNITEFKVTNLCKDNWNDEYEALNLSVNDKSAKSRLAKKTPKKKGYFLTLWQKDQENNNTPYNYSEFKDLLIVNILDGNHKGQFVFPKEVLAERRILRTNESNGKMAFRVYPTWEDNLNVSATKAQRWQSRYFHDLTHVKDLKKIKSLYFDN